MAKLARDVNALVEKYSGYDANELLDSEIKEAKEKPTGLTTSVCNGEGGCGQNCTCDALNAQNWQMNYPKPQVNYCGPKPPAEPACCPQKPVIDTGPIVAMAYERAFAMLLEMQKAVCECNGRYGVQESQFYQGDASVVETASFRRR